MNYKIKGQEFAIYYYFTIAFPPEAPGKLSSTLNITDEVLRHMIVRADARREKAVEDKEAENTNETNEEKGE